MRQIRALTAAVTLLVLSAGVPLALAATIGNPLHSWSSIRAGDMSDTDVMAMMATVAYLAWATFALALIAEVAETIAAAVRSGPRRAIRIPLLGPQQDLARTLIAAMLLLTPVLTSAVGSVATAHASTSVSAALPVTHPAAGSRHQPNVAAPRPSADSRATETYVIPDRGGYRSYWALAAHYLGDGTRWREIWDLNHGRTQTDGAVMDTPRRLYTGWTVRIPADPTSPHEAAASTPTHDVVVHPGDTLSGLAAADGISDWQTLWPDNDDRTEPDGQHLTDPNLIRPGWTITLPDTTSHPPPPGVPSSPHQHPRNGARGGGSHPNDPTTRAPAAHTPTPDPTHPDAPEQVTPPTGTAEPNRARPAAPAAAGHDIQQPIVFGGGGLLLAGLSLTALARYRRRQFRARRPGRAIGRTPPELVDTERLVLAAGGAASSDVTWLDHAVRGLVQQLTARDDNRLPDVLAASMTDEVLTLVLATPAQHAPPPWQAAPDGTRWSLPRGEPTGYDPSTRGFFFAPYPALVSVGHTTTGERWLLDLERVGSLTLTGDLARCVDLARCMTAELANNTWSEMLHVTISGFGEHLTALNPDRLNTATDLATAVTALDRHRLSTAAAVEQCGVDVLTARAHDIAGDTWAPQVLIVGDPGADDWSTDPLRRALAAPPQRSATAVVLVSTHPSPDVDGWRASLDADGRFTLSTLNVELTACQLPADQADRLARLFSAAADPRDVPMPAAHDDGGCALTTDVAGNLLVCGDPAVTEPLRRPADASLPVAGSVLPLPDEHYLIHAASRRVDLAALAPHVNPPLADPVTVADPDLVADLAAWTDPASARPKVRVLGPVTVTAAGSLPDTSPRLAWNTELVAYLATRDSAVSTGRLGTDLWPDDPDIGGKTKVRQAIVVARRWLGTDPNTGREYLPVATAGNGLGTYRVHGVLVDADLLRRLRARGVTCGEDGISDLQAALDLVTGAPFDQQRPGGYSWLVDPPLAHEYTAMIVDTAHTLATHYLAADQPALASAAAQVALRAGSYEDTPLLDLVAAADAQDHHAEADTYIKRILANHDAEVEEDLPPRTAEILFRRQWLPRQAG